MNSLSPCCNAYTRIGYNGKEKVLICLKCMKEIEQDRTAEVMKLVIKPISINTCFQGRRFKTKAYNQYSKDVSILLMPYKHLHYSGDLKVSINFYIKNLYKPDLDNFIKPLIDQLVQNGIISDDRYITEYSLKKIKSDTDSIEIFIEGLK